MSPLPILRRRFWIFLLFSLISSFFVNAQQREDLEQLARNGETFHLKFFQPDPVSLEAQKAQQIQVLLDQYKNTLPSELQSPFKIQGEQAKQPPALTDGMKAALRDHSQRFFQSMSAMKITLRDLQQFRSQYKGNNPANPEAAWIADYQSVERTLMGGRTLLVMNVWQQTLVEFFRKNPDAVGVVYGQMDIGSWVKMSVDGLGFPADIDFSTLAIDPALNKKLQALFETNLRSETGLKMIPIDVVLTPHGQAGAEVYIGEWGKVFAEVDMLRRGRWKLMYVERNEKGQVTDVVMKERPGKELFLEQGKILDKKTEKVDPHNFDPVEKYPELKIDMEPMLSLEMLRHGLHDVQEGPFSGSQKIIKLIKYTERSFFMMEEVSKNLAAAGTPWNYDPDPDPSLKEAAKAIIKNKENMSLVTSELEKLTGKKLDTREAMNSVVDEISKRCQDAMLANAKRAFGFRVLKIAQIKDEGQRFDEAERMLKQLNEEFKQGYEAGKTEIPKTMLRAHTLLVDLRAGNLNPDQLDSKLAELNKLMADEYKIDQSWTERIIADAWSPISKWLEKKGFKEEQQKKIIGKFKNIFNVDWRRYVPEYAAEKAIPVQKFAASVQQKLNTVNDAIMQSKAGRIISSQVMNQADNFFAVYDAFMSGKDWTQGIWRGSSMIVTIAAQTNWPQLAIPLGFYNAYQSGNPTPAIMAVAFYLFPAGGQIYMATSLLERVVLSNVRDKNFRNHLYKLSESAVVENNKLVRLRVAKPYSDQNTGAEKIYFESDNIPAKEPARSAVLAEIFDNPELPARAEITYFRELVPKRSDQSKMYDTKMEQLKALFSFDPEMAGYIFTIQEFVKNKLPDDDLSGVREKMLDSLQYTIESMMWIAIGNAIESMQAGEDPELKKKYEDSIRELEESCLMRDSRMKKIDAMGLLTRVQFEIGNDTYLKQSQGDVFAKGTAFGRIAIPIYEKYINTYRRINEIRASIFERWNEFGINTSAIQEEPMRLLLMGSIDGAPMLTGNPDTDMEAAISCLEGHNRQASTIRLDLVTALGRPYDETTDKEHLRNLAQIGFEYEHLVDANPHGRSPGFVDKTGIIRNAIQERKRLYKAYLEKIKEGPPVNLALKVEGENSTTVSNPVKIKVTLLNDKKQTVLPPAGTVVEWYLYDENTLKELKVAEGLQYTHDAARQGNFTYTIRLYKKANNKTSLVASRHFSVSVNRFDATHPTNGIVLKVPALIKQYDIVTASITLPPALKGREVRCYWPYTTIGKKDDCSGVTIQFSNEQYTLDNDGKKLLQDSITIQAEVTIVTPGQTYGDTYTISKKVKFQHLSIQVKASDIWEGNAGANGFRLNRKRVHNGPRYIGTTIPPGETPKSTASANAAVYMQSYDAMGRFSSLEELKAFTEKRAKDDAGKMPEVKEVAVGDFKGYGLYYKPKYKEGRGGGLGFVDAVADANFSGHILKGKKIFEVVWYANASGAFDNSDQPWMMNMVNQLSAEAAGILNGASFQPDGRFVKTPYTGPNPDGSDYPQVSIEPKKDRILPGSKILVKAVIKNDKPGYGPYTYRWSGDVEGSTNGSSAQLASGRPGKKTISVFVNGPTPPGSASMEYEVALLPVKLVKVTPPGNKILPGAPVELKAEFTGPVPAGRKFVYQWQPHPQEKFIPFEGTGNSTKVSFTSPGVKKIWVEVLDKTTGDVYTAGRSDQLELQVTSPSFTLTLTPPKAMVGQWVTAKVSSGINPGDLDYRWIPLPDNGNLVKESSAGDEIIFYAKNTSPLTLNVQVREKGTGMQLAEASASFTAEHYKITVEGPKVQGPKPMIWKPGVGLVEVDKEIAVHQIVEFSVLVSPQPESELTYKWQITSGNASISNPTSRDARITALETGQVQARVTVKDKNGIELGSSSGVFNATISSDMISSGNKQKILFDEKMQLARKILNEGKLDDLVKTGLELKEMNPKDAEPILNEIVTACNKGAAYAIRLKDFTLAKKRCEQALQIHPADPTSQKLLEEARRGQQEQQIIYTDFLSIRSTIEKGFTADPKKGPEWMENTALNMFSQFDPRQKEMIDYARNLKSKKDDFDLTKARADDLKNQGQKAEAAGQINLAIKKYKESIALVRNPALETKILELEAKLNKPPDDDTVVDAGRLKLLAYYPFNGNANDESGNRRHGSTRNGAALAQDRFGNPNSAYAFDGRDDYIEVSATGLPEYDRTVMFWMKPAAGNPPAYPLSYGGGSICGISFIVGYNAANSNTYNTQGHCNMNDLVTAPWNTDPSNQWKHIAITISGKTIKFYINSILVKTTQTFSYPTNVSGKKLIIGGLVNPEGLAAYVAATGGYFKGTLDEVRIYGAAMTDEQVSAAYREQQQVKRSEKPDPNVINAEWTWTAYGYSGTVGKRYTFLLPPGGFISGHIRGTDIYPTDNALGGTAVHAGLITLKDGGTVTIEIQPGQTYYEGTTRNAVTSHPWRNYEKSFVFVTEQTKPPARYADAIIGTWYTHPPKEIGKRFTYYFPPGGTPNKRVWGTDIYTYDCSIASAAVHAGLLSVKDGGIVTIEVQPGLTHYEGTTRNGVTSTSYTAFEASFIFITEQSKPPAPFTDAIIGTWYTHPPKEIGKRFTYYFPPGGTPNNRVWGTDIYTYDCSIASAAVHAGLITAKDGGVVTIEIIKGQSSYQGSTRNGVTSTGYGAFDASFIFIKQGQ